MAESLLLAPTPSVPISYGHLFAMKGGTMIYVIDKPAAKKVLEHADKVSQRGIALEDISEQTASRKVEDLPFFRNPNSGLMG